MVLVLASANKFAGVAQKQVIEEMGVRKDVVSKLVASLVKAGLVTQDPEGRNPRANRLHTTDDGKALVMEIRTALKPRSAAAKEPEQPLKPPATVWDIY